MDVEKMLSYVHQDVIFQNISKGAVNAEANGIEKLRKMARQSLQLFSSRNQTMTSFKEQGATFEVGIDFEAVAAVDLPGRVKVGDSKRLEVKSVFEMKDK